MGDCMPIRYYGRRAFWAGVAIGVIVTLLVLGLLGRL